MESIEQELESLHRQGLYRQLQTPKGLDFSSNDYLGLSREPTLKKRMAEFLLDSSHSLSSVASRLVRGSLNVHQETEEFLKAHFRREDCLLFGSGFAANEGLLETLTARGVVYTDELNHSSLPERVAAEPSSLPGFQAQ